MFRAALLHGLLLGYRLSLRAAWSRFLSAANDPAGAQAEILRRLLRQARGTAFGRDHGLSRVRDLEGYRAAVPVRDYDGLEPWIQRAAQGESEVLTRSPLLAFEPTSGSTRAAKLIPLTAELRREFSAATGPWLHDLLTRAPGLDRGSAYWSISPLARPPQRTSGGIRLGLEDDTEYFPPLQRWVLGRLFPVSPRVARLADIEDCRYATLIYLLRDEGLAFISVWSPSFLILLLDAARAHAARLAEDLEQGCIRLPSGRAHELPLPSRSPRQSRALLRVFEGRESLRSIWPRLSLVSCWTSAEAGQLIPELKARLPRETTIQGKGLLATEGVISFPLWGQPGAVSAVASHLLEFEPQGETGRTALPQDLEPGGRYLPVISTGGGLYRYRLQDIVEVVGRWRRLPLLEFIGRADGGSDLVGEKLTPAFVAAALERVLVQARLTPRFALLAPDSALRPPRYKLYLDAAKYPPSLSQELDRALCEGPHYAYARDLGQLGSVQLVQVSDGLRRYEATLVARGHRAGAIKPAALHAGGFWGQVFDRPPVGDHD